MKHPVQKTNDEATTAAPTTTTNVPATCPAGHCGKAGHQPTGRKIGQFTITIVQNKPQQASENEQLQKFGPYAKNIAILQQLGFKRPGICLAFLKKTENDVGKAAEQLFLHRRSRQEACHQGAEQFATEIAELQSRGFKWKKMMIRLLTQFDGDVDKVSEIMAKRRAASEAKAAVNAASEPGEVDREALYADQIAALEASGFKCRKMMLRLLTKFDGDVEKVTEIITKRKAARQAKNGPAAAVTVASVTAAEPSREALAAELAECGEEPSVADPEAFYAEQIAALQDSGFKWKKLMIRLLAKHDGDVDKVSEIMAARKAARDAKAAAAAAEGAAEAAPTSALSKSDSVELSEEELREKLMEKFKGNTATVDRVMARRKAQAAKRQAQIQNKKQKMQANKEQRMKVKQERQQAKQLARKERMAQKQAAKQARLAAKAATKEASA